VDKTVGTDAREGRTAVCYCHLTCEPFDRTDAVEMRSVLERAQVEMSGSISGHDGLALGTHERQFITGSAESRGGYDLRTNGHGEPARRKSGARRTAGEKTSVKQMASGWHEGLLHDLPDPCPSFASMAYDLDHSAGRE
jgi:hypothetical protein